MEQETFIIILTVLVIGYILSIKNNRPSTKVAVIFQLKLRLAVYTVRLISLIFNTHFRTCQALLFLRVVFICFPLLSMV